MDANVENLELTKLRLNYAWGVFAFHARQRTTMFNFFLIAVGIVANGVALSLIYDLPDHFVALLLFVGVFLAVAFYHIDRRNCQLLEMGEDILSNLEREAVFKDFGSVTNFPYIPLGFLYREAAEVGRRKELQGSDSCDAGRSAAELRFLKPRTARRYRHGFWIPAIQLMVFTIFLLGLIGSFIGIF